MWLDQFQFAGFYLAKEKGFYEEAGLDVELKKYNSSLNITNEVLENRVDFGLNSSSLISDKANGKDIVLLGTTFQTSPLMLLSLEESGFKTIQDLKNKKLMITKEQQEFATFKAMLNSNNMDAKDFNILEHTFNIDDLINKKTDAVLAYTINEPFQLQEKGYKSKMFYPKDYGFDFYEGLIFTTTEFATKNPQLVNKFYNATVKGWEYVFENIDESAQIVFEKYNKQKKSLEAIKFEANEMKKLAFDKNGKFGTLNDEKINIIINTYKVMGLINSEISPKDLIYTLTQNLKIKLSDDEKSYLKFKKSLKVCSHQDLLPFEATVNNAHIGIIEDYFDLISKKLDLPIVFLPTTNWHESYSKTLKNECDFLSTIVKTKEREGIVNFTKPYLDFPFVIATGINTPFIENLHNLKDKKIGVVKGFATSEMLKDRYKNIDFVDVVNLNAGLKGVQKGELFAAIDSLAVVGYEIKNHFLGQLKVSGRIDENLKLSMATNIDNPMLASILDKTLDSITAVEKQEFFNKWVSISYEQHIDYETVVKIFIAIFILFIIFFLIYRFFLLRKMNLELNEKISLELKKNDVKNNLLLQQSKMAAMGEMLENIAHQWRQPLSTISVCASGMEIKKSISSLSDEEFYESVNHIKESVKYLSNTIDDFRSFLNQEKVVSSVIISSLIKKVLGILSPSFRSHNIQIIQDVEDIEFLSFENELIQALINILTNAKDALKNLPHEDDKFIFITIKSNDRNVIINVKDNALGIKEEIIERIFEPYFTTKHKSQGTGIGLYMTKLIIEKNIKGTISVTNDEYIFEDKNYIGANFSIVIPKVK